MHSLTAHQLSLLRPATGTVITPLSVLAVQVSAGPLTQRIEGNMPPTTVSRAVLRQSRFLTRRTAIRHNSSSSQAANKARETAQSTVSKASEGLSRVTSTAGPVIANAAQNIGSALRKIGGPAGRVISFVDRMSSPHYVHCPFIGILSRSLLYSLLSQFAKVVVVQA